MSAFLAAYGEVVSVLLAAIALIVFTVVVERNDGEGQ